MPALVLKQSVWDRKHQISRVASYFMKGVWLQSPFQLTPAPDQITYAQAYADIGINTYIGIYKWPDESYGYPGSNLDGIEALEDAGLKVFLGEDEAASDWFTAHPEFYDTILGFLMPDEPDMTKGVEGHMPDDYNAQAALLASWQPNYEVFANFGKGMCFDWGGYVVDPGPTKQDDMELYINSLNGYSCDFYPFTDPYQADTWRHISAYGDYIEYGLQYNSGTPMMGFIEVSTPWSQAVYDAYPQNNPEIPMNPAYIMPIVWNMICCGAKGYIFFCHNFYGDAPPTGWSSYAALLWEPGMAAACTAANASVEPYESIIIGDDYTGVTAAVTAGDVAVKFVTKVQSGEVYIFAMAHGDSTHLTGGAITVEFTVDSQSGISSKTVTVSEEARTKDMVNGVFSDDFSAYEVHIYHFTL